MKKMDTFQNVKILKNYRAGDLKVGDIINYGIIGSPAFAEIVNIHRKGKVVIFTATYTDDNGTRSGTYSFRHHADDLLDNVEIYEY